MLPRKALLALSISALALAACAPQMKRVASAAPLAKPDWAFEASDVPLEPGYRFGKTPGGMRYVSRSNAQP